MCHSISNAPVFRKSFFQLVRKGLRSARVVGSPQTGYRLGVDRREGEVVIVSDNFATRKLCEEFCIANTGRKPVIRPVKV